MSSCRLISLFIAFFVLTGCQFNLDKLEEKNNIINILQRENAQLRDYSSRQDAAIEKGNKILSKCRNELELHESGVAQKNAWWVSTWVIVFLFICGGILFSILINAYLIHYNRPKKHEIEEHKKRISSENVQVDGIKAEGAREQARVNALQQKADELEAQIEHQTEHLAGMKEQGQAALQIIEAKKAKAEDDLKLMTGFNLSFSAKTKK